MVFIGTAGFLLAPSTLPVPFGSTLFLLENKMFDLSSNGVSVARGIHTVLSGFVLVNNTLLMCAWCSATCNVPYVWQKASCNIH